MLTPPPVKRHRVRQTSGAAVDRLLLCHKFLYRCDEQNTTQQITTFLRVDVSEECSFLFSRRQKIKKSLQSELSEMQTEDQLAGQSGRIPESESEGRSSRK